VTRSLRPRCSSSKEQSSGAREIQRGLDELPAARCRQQLHPHADRKRRRRGSRPKQVRPLLYVTAEARERAPLIVVARYLSEGTRQRLRDGGVGYLDLTGNIQIVVSEPGLYIETQGASEDPDREERPARSLRGAKAGRIVRALIDRRQSPGVRELAALTNIDAGYVSRVLALLDSEALITRVGRGRMQSVDWPALLRRWAKEAPLESRSAALTCLEPRGLSALLSRLSESDERYVVTGGLAAAAFAPLAPPRLAAIWMRDATAAAERLRLRPAASDANVRCPSILRRPRARSRWPVCVCDGSLPEGNPLGHNGALKASAVSSLKVSISDGY
jgi:hypothetical protein